MKFIVLLTFIAVVCTKIQAKKQCSVVEPTEPPKSPCEQEKKVGPCKAAFPRYYFNSETQQCESFTWGGCQPNDNNFETIEECEGVCPTPKNPCEQEKKVGPCKAAFPRYFFNSETQQCESFTWGGCQPNDNNFETIEECEGVCPTKKNPCEEEQKIGPCEAIIPRYFFNSKTQQCESFDWGGCQANGNNFLSIEDCQSKCSKKTSPCDDELKVGPCRASFKRFYFDSVIKSCKVFFWGGCDPNGNNFETIEECERTCPIESQNPCYDPVVSGPCKAATTRYYFDQESHQCKLFIWGGCSPTGNNFLTVEDCENTCQAGRDQCLEPQDSGNCFAAFERFAFEPSSRQCQAFTWGGCGENGNNFETVEACESSCFGEFWKQ